MTQMPDNLQDLLIPGSLWRLRKPKVYNGVTNKTTVSFLTREHQHFTLKEIARLPGVTQIFIYSSFVFLKEDELIMVLDSLPGSIDPGDFGGHIRVIARGKVGDISGMNPSLWSQTFERVL